ncbi:ubiquitin domain-containing protein UBFD1-like isoform X2 [Oratosquilla oratoria]|uniref:ubiquitin domain-containing protein UBFD1-like isoform X2 n=1 Tax=Oratosquilla oratoria TaxID=337810 RepID=UPI003F7666A2
MSNESKQTTMNEADSTTKEGKPDSSQPESGGQEENNDDTGKQEAGAATTDADNDDTEATEAVADTAEEKKDQEMVNFKLIFNKTKYDIEFPLDNTIKQLKEHLQSLIYVLPAMQKVMIKGLAKDEKTLRELGVTKGMKVMVVGSKLDDVVNVNTAKTETPPAETPTAAATSKEPLCKQKNHKKIIDKGLPEDALQGIKNKRETLPLHPLSGMVNKSGGKVRLTFKLEMDQLWIGTKERTEKINMNHIRQVVSEPIEGHEQYHIMGLQLGPTEASRYWIYWVPAQFVDAIKDTVLGKW